MPIGAGSKLIIGLGAIGTDSPTRRLEQNTRYKPAQDFCPTHILTFKILQELLIDFQEIIGEHSGKNMAQTVWETLIFYGINDKVNHFYYIAFIYLIFP